MSNCNNLFFKDFKNILELQQIDTTLYPDDLIVIQPSPSKYPSINELINLSSILGIV